MSDYTYKDLTVALANSNKNNKRFKQTCQHKINYILFYKICF